MTTDISLKVLEIIFDIEEKGPQNPARLKVLKSWLSDPIRLASFSVFIAKRASGRKGNAKGKKADLFIKARNMLKNARDLNPQIPSMEAEMILQELRAYQNDQGKDKKDSTRIIRNRNLYLIEEGLRIYLQDRNNPASGYRLAASYCENHHPAYGTMLDQKSIFKIHEILRIMYSCEALEELS